MICLGLLMPLAIFAGVLDPADFAHEWEKDSITSKSGRLETGFNLGFANLQNNSSNLKTSSFSDYNDQLTGGMNFGAYVGYNVSNRFNVRIQYKYLTTQSSALYSVGLKSTGSDQSSLIYMEDNYQFHQVGPMVFYRINLFKEQLFLAPGLGASFIAFQNNGMTEVSYSQKSQAAVVDGYLGLEYFMSNHLGFGFSYYLSSPVEFINTSFEQDSDGNLQLQADDSFNLSDFSFRLMYLF